MTGILACDLGSTNFRAALVDPAGRILHLVTLPMERADASEIDPREWWTNLRAAVDRLAAQAGPGFDCVEAVVISGITRTQVFVDADGEPLRPAITWRDARADGVLPQVRSLLPETHPEFPQLGAFHPLARLAFLVREEPHHARALAAVIEPKDFLNLCLTGRCTIDPIGSARLIAATVGADGEAALRALGLATTIVPAVVEPGAVIGPVRADLPGAFARLAGRPVIAMGNDTWASVVGLGALRDGYAYNLSGTTEVLGLVSAKRVSADGLMSVDWRCGLTQIGGPSQNGADTLAWVADLLGGYTGISSADTLDLSLRGVRDGQPLIFLPYLLGERTPHWDPALRGAFVGLNRSHTATDCAFAALEGIAFLNRLVLERAEAAVGTAASEIRFGGGGAANGIWGQIKADVCGRSFAVTENTEPGLLGAAIVAFTALGRFGDLAAGQEALVRLRRRFVPRPKIAETYTRLYALFRETEAALAPISRKLAALKGATLA